MANDRDMSAATINLVNCGLTKGTTSTYTTTASTAGSIGGKFVTPITAQTNTATPTTDATTGAAFVAISANQATVLVIGQNAAGTIKMAQGGVEATEIGVTTTAGAFIRAPQFPALPMDFLPLGYLLVRAAPSASAWTPGTGSWTASGITASAVQNVTTMPDRPQTA